MAILKDGEYGSKRCVAHPSQMVSAGDDHAGGSTTLFLKWTAVWMVLIAILLPFLPSDTPSSITAAEAAVKPTGTGEAAPCVDTSHTCERWAEAGECQRNPR